MAAFTLTSTISINVHRTSSSRIHSSLSQKDNTSLSPSPPPPPPPSPPINKPQQTRLRSPPQKQSKPSLSQIERAIGAGDFRDRDTSKRDSGTGKPLIDVVLENTVEKEEGNLEKKLREIGEWLIDRTEKGNFSGSTGKSIVKTMFQFIIPIWILAFLVASGTVKLPFSSPFIDDLIM